MSEELSTELWISLFSTGVATAGLVFLGWQTRLQSRLARAQFIDKLSYDIDSHINIEIKLDKGGSLYEPTEVIDSENLKEIVMFLNFFDRLAHIFKLGLVNIKTLDDVFAYRFFILSHYPNVQNFELLRDDVKMYWTSVFALHKTWFSYRKYKKMPIMREDWLSVLTEDSVYRASKFADSE